jgi:hypothetical protein
MRLGNAIEPELIEKAIEFSDRIFRFEKDGFSVKTLDKTISDLNLESVYDNKIDQYKAMVSMMTGDSASVIGQDRYQVYNSLIQDYAPDVNPQKESPLNKMIPFEKFDAPTVQADIMSSLYGAASTSNGLFGSISFLPMLEVQSKQYSGIQVDLESFITGNEILKLRMPGSSNISESGAMTRWSYQRLLHLLQIHTYIELARIDTCARFNFAYTQNNIIENITVAVPYGNLYTMSENFTTYNKTTKTFTPNPSFAGNIFDMLGQWIIEIANAGFNVEGLLIDNLSYLQIIKTPAIANQLSLMNTFTTNNVEAGRKLIWQNSNVPQLQNIPILVDQRTWKINSDVTSTQNTRPLLFGTGDVTRESFRIIPIIKPKNLSRVGVTGLFPNAYNEMLKLGPLVNGSASTENGEQNSIYMAEQNMSLTDVTNSKIRLVTSATFCPSIFLENALFAFQLGVNVIS